MVLRPGVLSDQDHGQHCPDKPEICFKGSQEKPKSALDIDVDIDMEIDIVIHIKRKIQI